MRTHKPPSVDTPSSMAALLARTASQQWTAKSTESSHGRPIQREVYPFHYASRHMHAGSKRRDLNPETKSHFDFLPVQRLSTEGLPTTGHVMKLKACASRQLASEVSADISPHSTCQPYARSTRSIARPRSLCRSRSCDSIWRIPHTTPFIRHLCVSIIPTRVRLGS